MLKLKKKSMFLLSFMLQVVTLGTILIFSSNVFADSGSTASISEILSNQNSDGGWKKDYTVTSGEWAKSTIDNGATYTEIRRLAADYAQTYNSACSTAAIKGINFLLNMQYSNGGWPQIYNSTDYHTHITYNDDAMINVMYLLDDVANISGDFYFVSSELANSCKTAVDNGLSCILKTQVVANGVLTVWGQQHDEVTLEPTGARSYEVASLCSAESVGIVEFLLTRTSTSEINASIEAAIDWCNLVQIDGISVVNTGTDVVVVEDSSADPIWARFYEIGTNKPIFVGRDGIVKYNLSEIELERRLGYAWYGTWPAAIVDITVPDTTFYVKISNLTTGMYIDGMSRTADGSNAAQYASSSSTNQQWALETSGSYYKIKNRTTGLYLDGMGRTDNGSICAQYSSSTSTNQQWTLEAVGSYYKIKNRTTGLYLDGVGSSTNGYDLKQYSSSSSTNQQWSIIGQ